MVVVLLEPIITLLLLILAVFVALKLGKGLIYLLVNSLIGLVIFTLLNFTPFFNIKVNLWSILIVAIAGIPGVIIVMGLNFFGLLF